MLQNSNPIFSLVVFDQQGEKKEHLNIDEDIKITVCTCWQQSINNTKKQRPSFSFYYIIKLKNKVRLNKGGLEWFETKVRLSQ